MARNRKRAKERKARRPAQAGGSRQGLPTVTPEAEENGAPDPLEHAAPDVELADVQLAVGRPEEQEPGDEADEEEFEREVEESIADGGRRGGGAGRGAIHADSGGGELAVPGEAHPAQRVGMPARLAGFLQGSWRELQRVQWPDRRQVAQATGVVIGFVIVAGVFLGVADVVAQKIVKFILG